MTAIIFFDRLNKWKPSYQCTLYTSNKALFQSKILFIKTLLITFWLACWLHKSTLKVPLDVTSHLKSQDFYLMLLMVCLSKGNLDFSPFVALVPFPQVELPTSDSKIHPGKGHDFPLKTQLGSPGSTERLLLLTERKRSWDSSGAVRTKHHLSTFLPVTH